MKLPATNADHDLLSILVTCWSQQIMSKESSSIAAAGQAASLFDFGFSDFREAAKVVLKFLQARHQFGLWMITRTEGEDGIVLSSEDHGYGVKEGDVFRWADSFCSEMVLGRGPRVASDCRSEPAYASCPIAQRIPIGAYIGTPLSDRDGNLFGTLCGIDPNPRDDSLVDELPLVDLLGRLLNSLLVAEMKASAELRRFELTKLSELVDSESGLLSSAAWQSVLSAEELRCQRFGHPAAVASISITDVNCMADAAHVLSEFVVADETIARIGEQQFAWLGPELGRAKASDRLSILVDQFSTAKIDHVIQQACRDPRTGLQKLADEVMSPRSD